MWNLSTFSNYQVDFQDQIFHLNFLIKHDFFLITLNWNWESQTSLSSFDMVWLGKVIERGRTQDVKGESKSDVEM